MITFSSCARNASWPDNPRSAARRAAQGLVTINSYRDSDSTAFKRPCPTSKKVKYLVYLELYTLKNAGLNSWYWAVGTCEIGPVTYIPFLFDNHSEIVFIRITAPKFKEARPK